MIKISEFDAVDAEGFRAFSLYNPHGAEIMRVSVHFENYERYLLETESEPAKYTPTENERLKRAAVLSASYRTAIAAGTTMR